MNPFKILLIAVLSLTLSGTAFAATPGKVGTLQPKKFMMLARDFQKKRGELLDKTQKAKRDELNKMRAEIKSLEAQRASLSKAQTPAEQKTRKDKLKQIDQKVVALRTKLRNEHMQIEKSLMKARRADREHFLEQWKSVIATVAKKHDISFVVPDEILFFADTRIDITDEVYKMMQAKISQ